jgi:hypothetical protein
MQLVNEFINGPAIYATQHQWGSLETLALIWLGMYVDVLILCLLGLALFKLIQNALPILGWVLRRFKVGDECLPDTFLELTFPHDNSKSALASEQLHRILQSGLHPNGRIPRLAAHKKTYTFEMVATRDGGIRYVIAVPAAEVEPIKRSLLSFMPDLKISEINDYLGKVEHGPVAVAELKFAADFVLTLQSQNALDEHDPMAYITGHMTKLSQGDMVAFQMVTSPIATATHHRVIRRVRRLEKAVAEGLSLVWVLSKYPKVPNLLLFFALPPVWLALMGLKFLVSLPVLLIDPDSPNLLILPQGTQLSPENANPYEDELRTLIKGKLDQPLFETSIRILVSSANAAEISHRMNSLISAFSPFASRYQSLHFRRTFKIISPPERLEAWFRQRKLSTYLMAQNPVISSSELSDLYHLPNTDLTKTEDLVSSRSRELPAPLSHKGVRSQLDVVVGQNQFGGQTTPIGMTLEQRQKHTYIIGKTGTGKTTMLKNAIYQDMLSGKGLAVFDPHGDLFHELLEIIPEGRRKDIVIFNPADRAWPIGINILDPGVAFENEDDRQEWITSTVISVFAKLAAKEQWGPRMEHILRNTTLTALQTPNPNLYTLQRLLTDKKYQKHVAATLKDPVLKQFWSKEFALLGTMQMSSVTAPLTHRLGHFISTKMSRHILLQEKSTLKIADVMDEGKILLVNLSKGDLGEDQSTFFGTVLTSFIWMAAYQRTKILERDRRDFFVYIDEFQNFATPRFSEITSEGRKFHVALTVSHQNIAQIEDQNILKIVAGNANTIISLSSSPDDEAFILPFMKPEVQKGDIVNLPPHHFYMKAANGTSEAAFSGQTVPLEIVGSAAVKDTVIESSRRQYGTPLAKVEAYLRELLAIPVSKRTAPKGAPAAPKQMNAKVL